MILLALVISQFPVWKADAAYSTDFKMSGATLVKYRGPDTNVTLPETVEVIGRGAFENNKDIELVVIPKSVKRIDPYAFWGCDNLDTVVLGTGLTEVGDYAFAGCEGLKQMTIPENVTSIGIQAFGNCSNMTDISIPGQTVTIHETAFDGCENLTIHAEEHTIAADYAEAFHQRQKEREEFEQTYVPGPSEIPAETPAPTPEPVEAMLGSTQIVNNKAVFLMNGWVLPVYDGISEPEMPPLADMMGSGRIPKYTIVDGEVVADQAYYGNMGLVSLALPEGIREIGQLSFARSSLSAVSLPKGTERIGYGAFYHCGSLGSVMLPDTVMCVEPKAFSYTPWVENFLSGQTGEGDFLIEGGVLIAYRGSFLNVEIPEGVRVIAGEAFKDHEEIKSVSFPDSLRVVGEGAFEGCSQLRQIRFGQGVEEIKDRAFSGISTLMSSVTLPSSIKKLGIKAFDNVWLNYQGEEPEHTYESSASRLSNREYREYESDLVQTPGVVVSGMDGSISAVLEEADKSYILSFGALQESKEMEEAFLRAFQESMPVNGILYDLEFVDDSMIPLTDLGTQALTVTLPVPDSLKGQRLRLLGLDRNGQAVDIPLEQSSDNGRDVIRFRLNYVSQLALYGTGDSATAAPIETEVSVANQNAAPGDIKSDPYLLQGEEAVNKGPLWQRMEVWIGIGAILTGLILFLARCKKRQGINR